MIVLTPKEEILNQPQLTQLQPQGLTNGDSRKRLLQELFWCNPPWHPDLL